MCYGAFDDIIEAISALDADVISIENSRSPGDDPGLLRGTGYDNEIGPGVYNIHSPACSTRTSSTPSCGPGSQMPADRLWVNPDCGLKTRTWDEVLPALAHMVEAARSPAGGDCRRSHGGAAGGLTGTCD